MTIKRTLSFLATAILATTTVAQSAFAQSAQVYDASIQAFECSNVPGATSTNWFAAFAVQDPTDNLSGDGIINGQNLVLLSNGLFTRNPNPRRVWFLRTTVSGSGPSNSLAGYRLRIIRVSTRSRENSNFRSIEIWFRADPSVPRNIITVIGYPQNPNQQAQSLNFAQMNVTGTPGDWQVARATFDQFGFPNNIFVRQFNVYQQNLANTTSTVEFGRFNVRLQPFNILETSEIFFENLRCNGFSRD